MFFFFIILREVGIIRAKHILKINCVKIGSLAKSIIKFLTNMSINGNNAIYLSFAKMRFLFGASGRIFIQLLLGGN